MDKNTIIGLVIIVLILVGYSWLKRETPEEHEARVAAAEEKSRIQDSLNIANAIVTEDLFTNADTSGSSTVNHGQVAPTSSGTIVSTANTALTDTNVYDLVVNSFPQINPKSDNIQFQQKYDSVVQQRRLTEASKAKYGVFAPASIQQDSEYYTIENERLRLRVSSKGGQIVEAHIKNYKSYQDFMNDTSETPNSIQLFDEDSTSQNLVLNESWDDKGNKKKYNTTDLYFTSSEIEQNSIKLRARTNDPDKYLEFHYHLDTGYVLNYDVNFVGLDQKIMITESTFDWKMKGLSTEKLVSQERTICGIFYKCKGDSRDYLGETGSDYEDDFSTDLEWIAFKHNYFTSMLFMDDGFDKSDAKLEVIVDPVSQKYTKQYLAKVNIAKAANQLNSHTTIPLKMYFGPNDFEQLSALDMEADGIINLGPSIFRAVNKWFIIPIFDMLQSTGLGYGMIIILMTLIIKVVILPLTYKNYKSSAKMRILKPEITKITEKYPDKADAMKKQQETMSLYKKSGASPMAGCIPMLIQMPILFAAFRFFPSSMDLRQQSFLWAEDLSAYDAIVSWDTYIPLLSDIYGNHVSLFTIFMCVSTIFYTKMNSGQMQASQPGMPNMKVIMYIFPIMMLFFFNKFASGLSLYYLCGNVMNMGLMWVVKKYFIDEKKLETQMSAKSQQPKKQSKFQQRLSEMSKQQQAKQRARR